MQTSKVADIFNACQKSVSLHPSLTKKLKYLYDQEEDKKLFWETIINIVKRFLICQHRDNPIESGITFIGNFCASVVEDADDCVDTNEPKPVMLSSTVHIFFSFLLDNIAATSSIIRFRACQIFHMIFNFMGENIEIEENMYDMIYKKLLPTLKDKSPLVRTYSVLATTPFQDVNKTNCPITNEFLFMLSHDPYQYVRKKVLSNILLYKLTLPTIIKQCRDPNLSIRKLVFEIIADKVPLKYITISQRLELLETGLYDKFEVIRQVCYEKLVKKWLSHFENNILSLLSFLDLQNSQGINVTLLKLYINEHNSNPQFLFSQLSFDPQTHLLKICDCSYFHYHMNDTKIMDTTNAIEVCGNKCYLAEALFYWTYLISHFKSLSLQNAKSIVYELIVPSSTSILVDWMELYVLKFLNEEHQDSDSSEDSVERTMKNQRKIFIMKQFLILFHLIDMSDEAGRKRLLQFLKSGIPKLTTATNNCIDDELCRDLVRTFAMCHYLKSESPCSGTQPTNGEPPASSYEDGENFTNIAHNIWVNDKSSSLANERSIYNGSDFALIPNVLEIISDILHPLEPEQEPQKLDVPPSGPRSKSFGNQTGKSESIKDQLKGMRRSEKITIYSNDHAGIHQKAELRDRNIPTTTLKYALTIASETFKIYVCHRKIGPVGAGQSGDAYARHNLALLKPLYKLLIIPGLACHESSVVRALAFECLGAMCMMDREMVAGQFPLFIQPLDIDADVVKEAVLKVLFDLYIMYPPKTDLPSINSNHSTSEEMACAGDHNGSVIDPKFAPEYLQDKLITFLDAESPKDLQIECGKGLTKLILFGRLHSFRVMQKLMVIAFDNSYAHNPRLQKIINAFLNIYSLHSASNQKVTTKVACTLITQMLTQKLPNLNYPNMDESNEVDDTLAPNQTDIFAEDSAKINFETLNLEAFLAFVFQCTDWRKMREKMAREQYIEAYKETPHAALKRHITQQLVRLNDIRDNCGNVLGVESYVKKAPLKSFVRFMSCLTLEDDQHETLNSIGQEWKNFDIDTIKDRLTKKLLTQIMLSTPILDIAKEVNGDIE